MPAPTMLIWRKDLPGLYDVQLPTGELKFGLTQGQVRHLVLENHYAVAYPTTPAPSPG